MVILDPLGMTFDAMVAIGLTFDLLLKSDLSILWIVSGSIAKISLHHIFWIGLLKAANSIFNSKQVDFFFQLKEEKKYELLCWVIESHGSYKWIIMLEKCGRSDLNVFTSNE